MASKNVRDTAGMLNINTATESAYKAKNVFSDVYGTVRQMDAETRDELARSTLNVLSRPPEVGEDIRLVRCAGKRVLFALAQSQIDEHEDIEARIKKGGKEIRAAGRSAWLAVSGAMDSSFSQSYGRVRNGWTRTRSDVVSAHLDRRFQDALSSIGIKAGKITPDLRRACKAALSKAKREGTDPLDACADWKNK